MPKSKEIISDTGSDSGSSSEEEAKQKSKPKKPQKKESTSESELSESEEDTKSKKRTKNVKDNKAPATKKAKKEIKTNSSGEPMWDLGANKHVTVRTFKGRLLVDVREMYLDKDGELKPGRKGISLSLENWRELVRIVGEVDECVKSKS